METQYLHEFVILAELCNYQEAAETLHVSQSALSKHIQKLEDELGVVLFDRSSRAITLSRYGASFLSYVQRMDALREEALQQLEIIRASDDSHLVVAWPPEGEGDPGSLPDPSAKGFKMHWNVRKRIPAPVVRQLADIPAVDGALLEKWDGPEKCAGEINLLVAGQWDPEKMGKLTGSNFWICVARNDLKAFPGMNAVTAALEENGAEVGHYTWDSRCSLEEFNALARKAMEDDVHIRHTVFWDRGENGEERPWMGHDGT